MEEEFSSCKQLLSVLTDSQKRSKTNTGCQPFPPPSSLTALSLSLSLSLSLNQPTHSFVLQAINAMPPKRKAPKSANRTPPTRSSSRLQASPITPGKDELPKEIPPPDHHDDHNQYQTPPPPGTLSEKERVRAGEEAKQPRASEDGPSDLTQKDGGKDESVNVVKEVSVEEKVVVQQERDALVIGGKDEERANQPEILAAEGGGIKEKNDNSDEKLGEEEEQGDSEEGVEEEYAGKAANEVEDIQEGEEDTEEGVQEGTREEEEIEEEETAEADVRDVEEEDQKRGEELHGEAVAQEEEIEGQRGEEREGDAQEEMSEDEEEETEGEETREADAVAVPMEERKKLKDYEVFIGGLDKNILEDDLKKVFSEVGEVVQVRLVKKSLSKGFAFVRFATVDQAKAAAELKSVKINGGNCGVRRNTDNETLFLRNIRRTWTSSNLMEKLQSYKIENLVDAHLIDDPDNKGKNRGYGFLEFCTHMDAVTACTKLQKRGVYFGTDSPVEVAFAKSAVQPDEGIMAQVKSVFLDGLSSSWDEDHVKEQLKIYGEIEKVELARDMVTAKRKDFAFVNFVTREAALSCIAGVNKDGIGVNDEKVMVKASLRKPLQKRPATRGGWRGFSRHDEMPRKNYAPVRETGYSERSSYSKGDRWYRKDFPPSSGRSSTWHARDFYRREPTYSYGGRSRGRYVEDPPYVCREEYPAVYSDYSSQSQRRYTYMDDDAYAPGYEHYPESMPMGQEYLPLSGSKRSYSGGEDMFYARHTRIRTDLDSEAVHSNWSSGYDSYSRTVPQSGQGYGTVNQSVGSRYMSGSSSTRSYY